MSKNLFLFHIIKLPCAGKNPNNITSYHRHPHSETFVTSTAETIDSDRQMPLMPPSLVYLHIPVMYSIHFHKNFFCAAESRYRGPFIFVPLMTSLCFFHLGFLSLRGQDHISFVLLALTPIPILAAHRLSRILRKTDLASTCSLSLLNVTVNILSLSDTWRNPNSYLRFFTVTINSPDIRNRFVQLPS